MTVRLTESRLPTGYTASDLGRDHEVAVPGGGKYILVSFLTSVVQHTIQEYVVFAIDADADEYRWTIDELSPGGGPEITTTDVGILEVLYDNPGGYDVTVEIIENGAVVTSLNILEIVGPRDSALEQRITQEYIGAETADILRELRNDFRSYIQLASDATPAADGIPTRLIAAILDYETHIHPKRGTAGAYELAKAGDPSKIRETEIADLAAAYDKPWLAPLPKTLGPGQLGEPRVASLEGLMPWREAFLGTPLVRRILLIEDADDFYELNYLKQIDTFNLVRFPKSNIALVAKLLARLKNRSNRWPGVAKADVLADLDLVSVVATEYHLGPSMIDAQYAKPDGYGLIVAAMCEGNNPLLEFPLDLFP